MTSKCDDVLLSQLADGELAGDEANELLLAVLDDAAGREKLRQFLQLRQATAAWRSQQPTRSPITKTSQSRSAHRVWRGVSLAAAACLGGALVLAGVWAGWLGGRAKAPADVASSVRRPASARLVTADQMQQVANVFALHESVAGPLAWYASDDQNIRLAAARGAEGEGAPVAVLLRLAPVSPAGTSRTFVIVCREDESAAIELPSSVSGLDGVRMTLIPREVNGSLEIQYAITVGGGSRDAALASLAGQQRIGLTDAPLGQLSVGSNLVAINATAWAMKGKRN